jgi:hypothetical protein
MKKAVLIFGIFLSATAAMAQRHDFSVTHGWNSSLADKTGAYPNETGGTDFVTGVFVFLISPEAWLNYVTNAPEYDRVIRHDVDAKSHYTLAYRYTGLNSEGQPRLSSWGLSLTKASYSHEKTWQSGRKTFTQDKFSGVMVDYRLTWLRKKYVRAYSGLGIGLTSHRMSGSVNERRNFISGQYVPLGFQAFYKNVGAQVEVGFGSRGTVSAGAVVRLGK